MAIEGFNYKDQALGTGDENSYTFDFLIHDPSHLLIWLQDGSGAVVSSHRGDDETFISSLVFDSVNGGGTITLVDDLPDTYVMTMFPANDTPDQPAAFPNKTSFTLDAIEAALDYIARWGMRVAFLAQRSVRMHEVDDIDDFDPTLPSGITGYPSYVLSVKEDGSGFEFVVTVSEVANAEGNAEAAAASADAAAASALASFNSAQAAAASAATATAGFYVKPGTNKNNPQVVAALVGFVPSLQGREMMFVSSAGGAVLVTANPQIPPGIQVGQELVLVGCSGANTLQVTDGTGLDLNGNMYLGLGDVLGLSWDGFNWAECFRRQVT